MDKKARKKEIEKKFEKEFGDFVKLCEEKGLHGVKAFMQEFGRFGANLVVKFEDIEERLDKLEGKKKKAKNR